MIRIALAFLALTAISHADERSELLSKVKQWQDQFADKTMFAHGEITWVMDNAPLGVENKKRIEPADSVLDTDLKRWRETVCGRGYLTKRGLADGVFTSTHEPLQQYPPKKAEPRNAISCDGKAHTYPFSWMLEMAYGAYDQDLIGVPMEGGSWIQSMINEADTVVRDGDHWRVAIERDDPDGTQLEQELVLQEDAYPVSLVFQRNDNDNVLSKQQWKFTFEFDGGMLVSATRSINRSNSRMPLTNVMYNEMTYEAIQFIEKAEDSNFVVNLLPGVEIKDNCHVESPRSSWWIYLVGAAVFVVGGIVAWRAKQ